VLEKRIQRGMQGKGRKKWKVDKGRDQKYNNKGADMEICEFRLEKRQDNRRKYKY